jgi:hypothetical protein
MASRHKLGEMQTDEVRVTFGLKADDKAGNPAIGKPGWKPIKQ